MHQDKTLVCQDCGKDFVFTQAEQDFYQQKGFTNEPKRCPDCRKMKKDKFRQMRSHKAPVEIICANCGKTDTVNFKPRGDKPVLCSDCFRKQREQGMPTQPMQDMQPGESMDIPEEPAAA